MTKEVASTVDEKHWNIELVKLLYDYIKHLTTLCTGSILVLVAFNEKFAAQPSWKFLLKIALVSFIISIISATVTMFGVAMLSEPRFVVRGMKHGLWGESKLITTTLLLTWFAFFLALISLVIFGFRNL